jgi:hypothetical protein
MILCEGHQICLNMQLTSHVVGFTTRLSDDSRGVHEKSNDEYMQKMDRPFSKEGLK